MSVLKSNLYLSNCDSVHGRNKDELFERAVWGLALGKKIIITPNMIIDNPNIHNIFYENTVKRFLYNNPGKIIIRHNHHKDKICLKDRFDSLDEDFIFSAHPSKPTKKTFPKEDLYAYSSNIEKLDLFFEEIDAEHQKVGLTESSLYCKILCAMKTQSEKNNNNFISNDIFEEKIEFYKKNRKLVSRSDWYNFSEKEFPEISDKIKFSFIDPCYNDLFIREKEVYATDRAKSGSLIFSKALLVKETHQKKIDTAKGILKLIRFVHTFPIDGISYIINEYIGEEIKEDLKDRVLDYVQTTETWQKMYGKILGQIGLGLKTDD